MIHIKTQDEISMMMDAGTIVAGVFELLETLIVPGVRTIDLDREAETYIRSRGATPSFFHYGTPPFPANLCVSVNEEVVHGIPSSRRLTEGDIVSVDVGAYLNGFHADAARTFPVGAISSEARRLIEGVEACFWIGLKQAVCGQRVGDISHAVEMHAKGMGYGLVRQLTGHGIGRNLHEEPDVPNFGPAAHGPRLLAGMAIAIEPMINLGGDAIELMDDKWTFCTQDRRLAAHYENTVIITKEGPLITTMPKRVAQK